MSELSPRKRLVFLLRQRGLSYREIGERLRPPIGCHRARQIYLAVVMALSAGSAEAHDAWCDGKPVPANVKAACCGVADAHQVPTGEAREDGNGNFHLMIEGAEQTIPRERVSPSPDGCTWVWYARPTNGYVMGNVITVYCFMIPMGI